MLHFGAAFVHLEFVYWFVIQFSSLYASYETLYLNRKEQAISFVRQNRAQKEQNTRRP